jgi:hypothetical protein
LTYLFDRLAVMAKTSPQQDVFAEITEDDIDNLFND